jgi:hypothetical protein
MPTAPIETGSLAEWVSAGATLLAVIVALFKDEIIRWRRKPKLFVAVKLAPPDCQKTMLTYVVQRPALTRVAAECYYLRLWVENIGKTTAERVQVFAAKLFRRQADQSFREVEGFLPMNLRWAHGQPPDQTPEIFAQGISPNMGKHCDLGHIVDPKCRDEISGEGMPTVSTDNTVLALDLEVKPHTLSHLVPPGVYQLHLRVAGANCAPVTKILEINLTCQWFAAQERMFADGLGIRVVK